MAHIDLKNDLPGIRSLMAYRPETAAPMSELAELLLRSNNGLSPADREMIGMYVSYLNDCFYCHHSHKEIACIHLDGDRGLIDDVVTNFSKADISPKMKSLLSIAARVTQSGSAVTENDIERARSTGASDSDIHDTVLIASAFCLFNRYVDGLATLIPTDMESYHVRARQVVAFGYGKHIYDKTQPFSP